MACVDYLGSVSEQPGKARRSPRFPAFLATGGIVGLLVGLFLSVNGHPDNRYDDAAALGFLGLVCAGLGVLAGGIIAVLLDRRN